ncbi:mediator complex, subunit Med7 [Actinidia rufa]|uniref:Mediator of RNA polymerase II transcription subunit 7 n=1 Tax=Actinidia rufa TaxID=165716 RepID=A0A7J0FYB7_9ERIC|nr:mediator complex, subunit Med7 [Actinidia rufa]
MAATATYPPPPPYYKLYKDYTQNPKSAPEPPPPIEGTYVLFGSSYTTDDVLPSLEEQGVRQLYPKGPNIGGDREGDAALRNSKTRTQVMPDIGAT